MQSTEYLPRRPLCSDGSECNEPQERPYAGGNISSHLAKGMSKTWVLVRWIGCHDGSECNEPQEWLMLMAH